MKAEYIKVNGEIYLYVIITDDSGVRVEVRPQNSIITGNEQPVIKRYIT